MAVGPRSRGCTEPGLQAGSPAPPQEMYADLRKRILTWQSAGAGTHPVLTSN